MEGGAGAALGNFQRLLATHDENENENESLALPLFVVKRVTRQMRTTIGHTSIVRTSMVRYGRYWEGRGAFLLQFRYQVPWCFPIEITIAKVCKVSEYLVNYVV